MSAAGAPPPGTDTSSEPAEPAAAAQDAPAASEQSATQYVGPLAVTLRRVKVRMMRVAVCQTRGVTRRCVTRCTQLLSLGSLLVTTVGAPLLVFLSAPEGVSEMAKISLSGTVVLFGCFTTALLSYFASPYVLRLTLSGDDTATVTTMDLLARPRTVTIRLDEMREPRTLRPLATFEARGRIFFIDGNVADAALLQRMGLHKKENEPLQSGYDDSDDEDEAVPKKKAK
jgi:hypothetical protein